MREPATVVTDLDRDAGQQLLLNGDADLPVAGTDAPPLENGRIVRVREDRLAEVGVAERSAEIASAGEVVLREWVQQIAIRNEVFISISPGAGDGRRSGQLRRAADHSRGGIGGRIRIVIGGRLEILAGVHLEG